MWHIVPQWHKVRSQHIYIKIWQSNDASSLALSSCLKWNHPWWETQLMRQAFILILLPSSLSSDHGSMIICWSLERWSQEWVCNDFIGGVLAHNLRVVKVHFGQRRGKLKNLVKGSQIEGLINTLTDVEGKMADFYWQRKAWHQISHEVVKKGENMWQNHWL